jgi:methylated-DNA-protein-cysteine methyltransferase-like protein
MAPPYDPTQNGPHRIVGGGFHRRVHALVRVVPAGAVTTYGDIATALGSKSVARHVGYALAALPDGHDVPWWRVVAAGGRLSVAPAAAREQAQHLAAEGVAVTGGRVRAFAQRRYAFDISGEAPESGTDRNPG